MEAKEILLKTREVGIYEQQVKFQEKINILEKLKETERASFQEELTKSEIARTSTETKFKLAETKLAKQTKLEREKLEVPVWLTPLKTAVSVVALVKGAPVILDFFMNPTEDPINFSTLQQNTKQNFSNPDPKKPKTHSRKQSNSFVKS